MTNIKVENYVDIDIDISDISDDLVDLFSGDDADKCQELLDKVSGDTLRNINTYIRRLPLSSQVYEDIKEEAIKDAISEGSGLRAGAFFKADLSLYRLRNYAHGVSNELVLSKQDAEKILDLINTLAESYED